MKHGTKKAFKNKGKVKKPLPYARRKPQGRHPSRHTQTAKGVFCGTQRGFGFCALSGEEGQEDVFIPAGKTKGALDGDTVLVSYSTTREGKREGAVEEIIKKASITLIGTLCSVRIRGMRGNMLRYFVIPDSHRFPEEIGVDNIAEAKEGDKVELAITDRSRYVWGRVVRTFGPAHTKEANYASILAENGIIPDFEPEALRQAERVAATPLTEEGRRRFSTAILTIDGADAKDLDDAISLEKTKDGYILTVHIADVSEYVTPKTPLDRAALHRGTSVYFADKVIPMLPPALSNGACSLNAGEEKYTLSVILTLNKEGKLLQTEVVKGIIVSSVRGVYSEINELWENESSPYLEKYRALLPMLSDMRELYEKREKAARQRGCLSIEESEPYFVMGKDGIPTEITARQRGVSERMIEQFMLLANEGVATLLHQKGIPCVYRTHAEPPEDKLLDFMLYLHNLGLSPLPLRQEPLPVSAFSEVVKEAKEKDLLDAISLPLLRCMAKATYQTEPLGHFGLALPLYCHFTSPIRRLSDLAVHRILKGVLFEKESPAKYTAFARRAAAAAAKTELSAVNAERQMNAFYQALWAENHIGEEWQGSVSSVTSFGVFVRLDNSCEGLIPLSLLPFGAVYQENSLSVRFGKETLTISTRLSVQIVEAEALARRVTFSFLFVVPPKNT
ncbi:MAG: VacB/RNase II family 3'-5' exoribonuclease [Clostridia bacterium]|nr:VacB/RNase II family 3'-5' exoribonuclease [Clostridia bacterium]